MLSLRSSKWKRLIGIWEYGYDASHSVKAADNRFRVIGLNRGIAA